MRCRELVKEHYYIHLKWGVCVFKRMEVINGHPYAIFKFSDGEACEPAEDVQEEIRECPIENGKFPKLDTFNWRTYKQGKLNRWQKRVLKAHEQARRNAVSLVELYAEREQAQGFQFSKDNDLQRQFENSCPYELTSGQKQSLAEIKADMESDKTMDRLLLGDVGYGKTEVAMRAVFKAVQSHKQAIILAPTSVLAKQHYNDFSNRFKGYNINIVFLCSAIKTKERREILKNIEDGTANVIIGTHSILSNKIAYNDIGFIVTDEEQKFGVSAKEKIKRLQINIDSLSMSATPIPRTTEQTIAGITDVSKITTAPKTKKSVVTEIINSTNTNIIKKVIQNEIDRNGQIYFVENNIEKLSIIKEKLLQLMPSLRIIIVHGKMNNKEKDNIMDDFLNKKYDILLATSIIEIGINVKNANTIIINNADKFGLSSLWQLLGRVGRGKNQGYCYLLHDGSITSEGRERLKTLKENSKLGGGIKIAEKDLMMRGMGDLGGTMQHGKMFVPANIYMEILKKEIDKRKREQRENIKVYT